MVFDYILIISNNLTYLCLSTTYSPQKTLNIKSCANSVQDWPYLYWGRFNNVEVNSINTLQVTLL